MRCGEEARRASLYKNVIVPKRRRTYAAVSNTPPKGLRRYADTSLCIVYNYKLNNVDTSAQNDDDSETEARIKCLKFKIFIKKNHHHPSNYISIEIHIFIFYLFMLYVFIQKFYDIALSTHLLM